jgi:hypothetical protein
MKFTGDIIGIDLSLRSTGLVRLSLDGELLDFDIVRSPKLTEENLLLYNTKNIMKFIEMGKIYSVAIEGLSLNGKSAMKDMIDGNYWMVRSAIKKYNSKIFIGAIPVLTWRCDILSKKERKKAKKVKDGLKIFVVDKLDTEIQIAFLKYLKQQNLPNKSLYDLADAYFIAQHRIKLFLMDHPDYQNKS